MNEWEGHQIAGVQWIPVPSSQQLNEYYRGGSRNKTTHQNEFGELRDKAAQLFQIELTQNQYNASTGESQIIVSRVNFLKVPSCEILNEDPETIRVRQGKDMNKGILSISNLFRDLAATPQGDNAHYDESILTSLSRDIFGGNSLAIGVFCLQYGDIIGQKLALRALNRC